MKIIAISGLGADEKVYQFLDLGSPIEVIPWNTPLPNETLRNYALRLFKPYEKLNNILLLGVSFGGVVAQEIAKVHKVKQVVIISSLTHHKELRGWLRFIARTGLLQLLPKRMFIPPVWVSAYLFSTNRKPLLRAILESSDLVFTKWASIAMLNWEASEPFPDVIRIHGTADKILPKYSNSIEIDGGGHLMIVDRAEEVSSAILNALTE